MWERSGLHQLTGKIDTLEDATLLVKGCSLVFSILGVLMIIASIVVQDPWSWMVGFIWMVVAWLLKRFNSRLIAVLILSWLIVNAIRILYLAEDIPLLAILSGGLLLWLAVKAIKGTFKYHSFIKNTDTPERRLI